MGRRQPCSKTCDGRSNEVLQRLRQQCQGKAQGLLPEALPCHRSRKCPKKCHGACLGKCIGLAPRGAGPTVWARRGFQTPHCTSVAQTQIKMEEPCSC